MAQVSSLSQWGPHLQGPWKTCTSFALTTAGNLGSSQHGHHKGARWLVDFFRPGFMSSPTTAGGTGQVVIPTRLKVGKVAHPTPPHGSVWERAHNALDSSFQKHL